MLGAVHSVRALEQRVGLYLADGRCAPALAAVQDFVSRIVSEPLCTAQIYGSPELDALCQRIGLISYNKISLDLATARGDAQLLYVYLVTKLQNSGGHRQVLLDFIRARPAAEHLILSTELDGASDVLHLNGVLNGQMPVRFERAPGGDHGQRLRWLQERLLSLHPTRTYLFNHHQDAVAVAAIHPLMGLAASYYHHGDHHLCLGVHLTHMEHIDPHPMGYFNCQDGLGIRNIYLPLTAKDKGTRGDGELWRGGGRLVTCTAARSNKIEIPYFIRYVDVIPELLKSTGGRHVHIGRLTPWALWRLRRGLRRNGVTQDRFLYVPWVSSVWEALLEHKVDLYVASFPYGGALTLVEAMGAGIPVAMHRHIYSRFLSCVDMAYPGVFSWRNPEDLIAYCSTVSSDELRQGGASARRHFERYHRNEVLIELLNHSEACGVELPQSRLTFAISTGEWAAWMASQLSIGRLVYQGLHRLAKRLRAKWS